MLTFVVSRSRTTSAVGFGAVTVITGPERLLAERAIGQVLERCRSVAPELEVDRVPANALDGGRLAELASPSLLAAERVVVLDELTEFPAELAAQLTGIAATADADFALVLVHSGAVRNKKLIDSIRKLPTATVIDCPAVKSWELPQFVTREARTLGGSIDAEAAQLLVDAVGHELRALAAAVSQLLADSESGTVTARQVRSYFAGRAEVSSFAVADAALSGRIGPAMEQLRWALSTGVAPVLVTSAFAAGIRGLARFLGAPSGLREGDLAREVGVPPWKLKTIRAQARGWDQAALAAAMQAVARADAQIKGAADDPEFALEQLVVGVAGGRTRSAAGRGR